MQVMPSDQMSTRVVYSCSQTSSGACTPINHNHGSDCQHGTAVSYRVECVCGTRRTIQYGVPVAVLCLSIVFTICVATPKSAAKKSEVSGGGWAVVGGFEGCTELSRAFRVQQNIVCTSTQINPPKREE
jgi:hypothetical protein